MTATHIAVIRTAALTAALTSTLFVCLRHGAPISISAAAVAVSACAVAVLVALALVKKR